MDNNARFWQFRNEADGDTAELLLYNEIASNTWFGDEVTPQQFADDLKALGGKNLTLRINSPGGDVFAAHAIYNQLKAYTGTITAYIDGMAASAATVITCAADKVVMPDNAVFMIHNPTVGYTGWLDEQECSDLGNQLKKVKQSIINVYLKKCNLTASKLKKMMDEETWMCSDEALSYGFADAVEPSEAGFENSIRDGLVFVNNMSCRLDRFRNQKQLRAVLNHEHRKDETPMDNNAIMSLLNEIKDKITGSKPEEPKVDLVAAERQRMLDLDGMRNGNPTVDKIVDIAKKNGNTADEIKEYVDAVNEEKPSKDKGLEEIKDLIKDQMNSGAQNVPASVADPVVDDAAHQATDIANLVSLMKNIRGEK